ncbi:MAG: 5'-methylthioadenosine/adenosylhomocysteine nucleosidase [Cetobacterium sp.]
MKIGIISALALEIEEVKSSLLVKSEINLAGFKFFEAQYDKLEIIVAICDVGKVNSASCTQILVSYFGIDCIINLGVAGSMKSDVFLYDLIISEELVHYDVRKSQMIGRFPYQKAFKASDFLRNLAIKSADFIGKKYHVGIIATGESFITDSKIKEKIIKEFEPLCVEMEGAAIAHVAYINSIDFIVIRSISDNASISTNLNDKIIETASKNTAALMLEMLKELNLLKS